MIQRRLPDRSELWQGRRVPYLCGEAGTRRERRYGGGAGGDLGGAGRQLRRVLLVVYKGGEAEDTEAVGLAKRQHFALLFRPYQLLERRVVAEALLVLG